MTAGLARHAAVRNLDAGGINVRVRMSQEYEYALAEDGGRRVGGAQGRDDVGVAPEMIHLRRACSFVSEMGSMLTEQHAIGS